jgi:hypothetical protein
MLTPRADDGTVGENDNKRTDGEPCVPTVRNGEKRVNKNEIIGCPMLSRKGETGSKCGKSGCKFVPKTLFSEFVTGGDEQTLAGVARSDGHACEPSRTPLCRH